MIATLSAYAQASADTIIRDPILITHFWYN